MHLLVRAKGKKQGSSSVKSAKAHFHSEIGARRNNNFPLIIKQERVSFSPNLLIPFQVHSTLKQRDALPPATAALRQLSKQHTAELRGLLLRLLIATDNQPETVLSAKDQPRLHPSDRPPTQWLLQ